MPEFFTWAFLLINRQDEIGERQLSVLGSRGGQNIPLMHVPLCFLNYFYGKKIETMILFANCLSQINEHTTYGYPNE